MEPAATVADFYDQLAPFFHLVYADWDASIARQAIELDSVIRELWEGRVKSVLDAACSIGTQSIGLARLGYAVTGSDISAAAIHRARHEAALRTLVIPFGVADLRNLSACHSARFDLVLACDNAVPHLLCDDDIRLAFRQMHHCTSAGGGCLISVRDYSPAESSGTKVVPYGVRTAADRRYVVFQVWDFHGPHYDLAMYLVEDSGKSQCITHVMRSRYYAIAIDRLMQLMSEGGFTGVRRIDGRFFQPLVVGFKAS